MPASHLPRRHRPLRLPPADWALQVPFGGIKVSVIVTCKGRLHHLQQTLPSMLNQQGDPQHEVVIVDYGDPDNCLEWCINNGQSMLTAVRVLNRTEHFNLSRARNIGSRFASGQILCFVDADSVIHPYFLAGATRPIRAGLVELTTRDMRDRNITTAGVCAVTLKAHHAVRGYDEAIKGWASEDADFYNRVARIARIGSFPSAFLPDSIPHSNEARSRFYEVKDINDSWWKHASLLRRPDRLVNPNGFGVAAVSFASAATGWRVESRDLSDRLHPLDAC